MAKLAARGRTELFRMVHPPEGTHEFNQYVFLSDGAILSGGHGKYKVSRLGKNRTQAEIEAYLLSRNWVRKAGR